MKKTLFATVVMGIAFAALPAFAVDTLMIFSFRPAPDGFAGSFNSSGVIHEAATATSTIDYDPGVSNILTAHKTIHLAGGDIEMTVKGPLNTTKFPDVSLVGTWEFVGGTGIYTNVTGKGTCAVVGDFGAGTFSGAYRGKVKLTGDKNDDE